MGWETVNTTAGAFALLSLSVLVFGTEPDAKNTPFLALVCIAIFVACTVAVSGMGHAFILVIQKWASWTFGALNLLVAAYLLTTVDWASVTSTPAGPTSAVIIGIGVIAAGTGIGWANAGADMSRYQSARVRATSLVASASAGAGIPLVFIIGLGSLLAAGESGLASAADPVASVRELLPAWVAIPYLFTAFGGLLLSNYLSVYSAGLTTLTLGVRIRRVYAVILDVVVTTTGAIYFMLIADSFYGPFITFISLLAVPIVAWVGVFIVDMIGRTYYDPAGLMDLKATSRYWYTAGVQWRATASWAIAIATGLLLSTARVNETEVWFTGALADTWIGRNGLAWVATLLVAAGLYALMGGAKAGSQDTEEKV